MLGSIAHVRSTGHHLSMAKYADVDGVIDAWVQSNSLKLFTEWAGQPVRFIHVPGTPPFECFQISIDPPSDGRIMVLVRSIDTNDDSELEQAWEWSS
jgi:hypothetical protein